MELNTLICELKKIPFIEWHDIATEKTQPLFDTLLVTVKDETGDYAHSYVTVGTYFGNGIWSIDNEPHRDVIAWAQFPKPFERSKNNE